MSHNAWFAHYDPGVPYTLAPYPEKTLLDCISATARERPNHPCLLFKGRKMSYGEVEELSGRFAAALVDEGVRKGDRVALLLVNCPQAVIAQLGVWKAGAIAVPLNPLYTEPELEHALVQVGANLAVVLTLCYSRMKAVQPRTAIRRVIATNIKDYLPRHMALLFTLTREKKDGHRIALAEDDVWFTSLFRNVSLAPPMTVAPGDTALLLFTGGTTGSPKAAIIRHEGLLMAAMQLHVWIRDVLPSWNSVALLMLPLFHMFGNWLLATSMVGHNPVALVPDPRNVDDVVATIRQTKPASFAGVPAFYASILEHPRVKAGNVDFSCLKACSCGAAPLMAETARRWLRVVGTRITEGYALTESCVAATANPLQGLNKTGSAGIPLPDVEIRIVDADSGRQTLPAGQVGEICMRAPQMIRGYWGLPPESESMLRDGWLYTGDLGYADDDGYLFIVDRKKDVIKASGFQVWPREVEEAIAAHPAVAQVGVAGVPDSKRGEAVKAWVVLRPGNHASADEIRDHCRQHLAAYKVPREVEFRASLPTTLVGKMLRRELRAEAHAPQEAAHPPGRMHD